MGSQVLLLLIDVKVLIMMTSLQDIVILVLKAPSVDGIKIFEKNDQAAKQCSCYPNVLRPGHIY